jgi:hypothetical protein
MEGRSSPYHTTGQQYRCIERTKVIVGHGGELVRRYGVRQQQRRRKARRTTGRRAAESRACIYVGIVGPRFKRRRICECINQRYSSVRNQHRQRVVEPISIHAQAVRRSEHIADVGVILVHQDAAAGGREVYSTRFGCRGRCCNGIRPQCVCARNVLPLHNAKIYA